MSDEPCVLVVDDEQVVLDSVRKHLRREGYAIRTVLSAPEALEILDDEGADVVITDLMMPGMDGLELLARVRESRPGLPVVMITGYATMKTALQALRRGAFDYIAKPFTRAELQGVVARAVRGPGRGGRPVEPAGAAERPDHHLGHHCWVRVVDDGSVSVGLQEGFVSSVGTVETLELPDRGDQLEQGAVCLRVLAADGRTHTVWCPLSGSVIEVNADAVGCPDQLLRRPREEAWILRLAPRDLEEELSGLTSG